MEKKVEFKIGQEALRGSLFVPEGNGPFPAVVFYHGRGSDRKNYLSMAKKLSDKGILALAFDFRGCGESDGVFEEQKIKMGIEDAKAALEFLFSQNIDRDRLGIQGTSFGGYVTGMLLKDYDFIKTIVLRVPAAYSDKDIELSPKNFPGDTYYSQKEKWMDSSSYKGVARYKGKLLVIRSELDELIPEEAVNKYYEDAELASEKELYVQKGAMHSFTNDPEGREHFNEVVINWFLKTL